MVKKFRLSQSRIYTCLVILILLCRFLFADAQEAGRVITDMRGKEVIVPSVVNRVVGTGGAVDEWLLLLGSPHKLVATSPSIRNNQWYIKAFPGILKIPASINSNDTNVETLLSLKPDVALELSGVGLINTAEKAKIPTVVLERDNPRQLMEGILLAGRVLGPEEEKRAEAFCRYYQENIKRITDKTKLIPAEERPRVYYASKTNTTEGIGSIVTSWIEMGGGFNTATLTGVVSSTSQIVSIEQVINWDPEYIIVMGHELSDYILSNSQWQNISAVRQKRVFVMPKGIYYWGVRAAEEALQVLWIGKVLHPDLFPDLDMIHETRYFHKVFYNYDLSEEEAQWMLNGISPR